MSLATPESIRKLQRKLYLKAKDEPAFRFYLLYDKICREDILRHAYDLARANKGAPGVDGVTFAMIEASGREEWLAAIRKDLVAKTYRALPVRRVMIPKPGGGERPLGIPTIRDRVGSWVYCPYENQGETGDGRQMVKHSKWESASAAPSECRAQWSGLRPSRRVCPWLRRAFPLTDAPSRTTIVAATSAIRGIRVKGGN